MSIQLSVSSPPPPTSSGMFAANSPARIARRGAGGPAPGSSRPLRSTSSSWGTSSRCTNARVVSTTARCSGDSSRSTQTHFRAIRREACSGGGTSRASIRARSSSGNGLDRPARCPRARPAPPRWPAAGPRTTSRATARAACRSPRSPRAAPPAGRRAAPGRGSGRGPRACRPTCRCGQVLRGHAELGHHRVGGVPEHQHVVGLGQVSVVVDPLRTDVLDPASRSASGALPSTRSRSTSRAVALAHQVGDGARRRPPPRSRGPPRRAAPG